MTDRIAQRLQDYCAAAFPDRNKLQVQSLTCMNTGWENEMYSFDLSYTARDVPHCERLVLRIYPGDGAAAKSVREYTGMKLLEKAGYPVPTVRLLEYEHSPFGKPFVVMDRVAGETLWHYLVGSDGLPRGEYLTLFCDLFVRLHRLDWRPFAGGLQPNLATGLYAFVDQWLEMVYKETTRLHMPGFAPLIGWLEERRDRVPCSQPAVLHWDFHPANILLRADGSAFVIDWPGLRVSDARFDLGWTLLLARSYMGTASRDAILQEYERLAGARVAEIGYFEICACVRRMFDVTVSLSVGAEKMGMRPGAERVMQEQIGALTEVYDFMVKTTGIEVQEVQNLFR